MRDPELGFYSMTIYGDDLYLHTEDGSSLSNHEIVPNDDGRTFTLHFGSPETCGADAKNLLLAPTDNWTLALRVYMPGEGCRMTSTRCPTRSRSADRRCATKEFTMISILRQMLAGTAVLAVTAGMAAAQADRFQALADLPFEHNRPTEETAKTLLDELAFQRATQTYLWALEPEARTTEDRAAVLVLGEIVGVFIAAVGDPQLRIGAVDVLHQRKAPAIA